MILLQTRVPLYACRANRSAKLRYHRMLMVINVVCVLHISPFLPAFAVIFEKVCKIPPSPQAWGAQGTEEWYQCTKNRQTV